MYPGILRVPAAARCHCFRLPNKSLVLRCGGWYGVGPWGPPVGTSGTLPRTEWPKVVPPRRAFTHPPPSLSYVYYRSKFYSRIHQKQQRRKTRDRWQAALSWGGLTHAPSFSACQFVLSVPGGDGLLLLSVQSMSSPCMECCRESLEPASMRLFHNNIAQNYRVEGASPLWVEKQSTSHFLPSPPPKNGGHTNRVGRLTNCQVVRLGSLGAR